MSNEQDEREVSWATAMGVQVLRATATEVVAEVAIGPQHRQATGMVHGGVHCGLIESAVSMGASIVAQARGQLPPVGLENHTSFVRAVSNGRIRVTATPISSGRRSQIWEATVRDEAGEILATGRVRLLCASPPRSS